MCASCGCNKVNDQHGDQRNITLKDLDQAAQAAQISREEVVQNLVHSTEQVSPERTEGQAGRPSDVSEFSS